MPTARHSFPTIRRRCAVGVARGPAVAREEHQRRPIPSPAARDLSHPPTSLFFLLRGVDSGV
ncbi:hypothetical protein OG787_12130 [Streptomyces sp. NBC_00075]|uniref:hypothetical protein n=1 Tax=Streptomyces sp. NBC_00075 TaxID=2975641 RepID=UPI00324F9E11